MDRVSVEAERAGRNLALWSVFIGVVLSVVKIAIGLAAHSTALVSDGFEAAADVISSSIVFAGLWVASKPPDQNHPYGHGRYETVASLAVGGILGATGCAIFVRSFLTMNHQEQVSFFAIYPLLGAIAIKLVLAAMKWRAAQRIASSALAADAWHDLTDLFSTVVALIAVLISLADPARFHNADHIGGMVIALIVVYVGIGVIRQTVAQLTDTMPDDNTVTQIRAVALSVPGALGIEKCFARRTGFKYHVDLHLEVDPDLTVRASHDIAMQVKIELKTRLNWVADVLVHVEPAPELNNSVSGSPSKTSLGKP